MATQIMKMCQRNALMFAANPPNKKIMICFSIEMDISEGKCNQATVQQLKASRFRSRGELCRLPNEQLQEITGFDHMYCRNEAGTCK